MVSTRFDARTNKLWKQVARPVAKSEAGGPADLKGPPAVPPKPSGKVLLYVYEDPGKPGAYKTLSQVGGGVLPPNAQLVVQGVPPVTEYSTSHIRYPRSDECLGTESRLARLKNRAKKAGKGYKVIADVNRGPWRNSSRGGRMFMKQKERMENYTSTETSGQMEDDEYFPESKTLTSKERNISQWQERKTLKSTPKYVPASLRQDLTTDRERRGRILQPLRSPPLEWKAKVDSGYKLYDEDTLPTRRWNADSAERSLYVRSESAPPPEEEFWNGSHPHDEDRYYVRSVNEKRPDSRGYVPAAVNFDARMNKGASYRKQEARAGGGGVFHTTPHVQFDFNARAIGWSRAYAEQY